MNLPLRALLLALVLLGALPAQAGEMRRITVGGVERTYYLHLPANRRPTAPLVIVLHGATADGRNDVGRYGWEHVANNRGFIVAGPDAPTLRGGPPSNQNYRAWNHGGRTPGNISASDDVGFIAALIDDVSRAAAIDRRRIYVAGFSSGAAMAHRLALELPGRFAAISASAGGLMLPAYRRPERGVPILLSAGDRDPVTPVDGKGTFVADSHRTLIDKWRILDDCPAPRRLAAPKDLVIEASGPCRDGSEVRYVLMLGVDHAWRTDKPIDLTEASWEFFQRFSLP